MPESLCAVVSLRAVKMRMLSGTLRIPWQALSLTDKPALKKLSSVLMLERGRCRHQDGSSCCMLGSPAAPACSWASGAVLVLLNERLLQEQGLPHKHQTPTRERKGHPTEKPIMLKQGPCQSFQAGQTKPVCHRF